MAKDYIIVPKGLVESLLSICETKASEELSEVIDEYINEGEIELSPDNKLLYMVVKRERKKYKISQFDLAARAKMKQPDVSYFEKEGGRGFERKRKERLINALKELIKEKNKQSF